MIEEVKTVYRYDAGGSGFRKVAMFLAFLAGVLALFGIFWIKSWFLGNYMRNSIEYCTE